MGSPTQKRPHLWTIHPCQCQREGEAIGEEARVGLQRMKNEWSWKEQVALALWEVAAQITGWKYCYYKARGFRKLKIHIETERAKMTRQLWLAVMFDGQWTCVWCRMRNFKNQETSKAKMEVDHIKALFNGGYTVRSNLQVLCHWCNQRKGIN